MNRLRRRWLRYSDPVAYVRSLGVQVGERCKFVNVKSIRFGSEPHLISIGNHVELSTEVQILTHDGAVWVFRDEFPTMQYHASVMISDNVFIGSRATVLAGVAIGRDAIVAACSVVTKDVPSGVIVAGNPARVVGQVNDYRERMLAKATFDRVRDPIGLYERYLGVDELAADDSAYLLRKAKERERDGTD